MDLRDKVAIVTGSARRVGRAIALALARRGCHIIVHHNASADDARRTVDDIVACGVQAACVRADLAGPGGPDALIEAAIHQFGRLDILVNNAAIFPKDTLDDLGGALWQKTLQVNLTAPAQLARAAWPHFQRAGAGRIVNLTDISADRPWSSHTAYCVSKAGLVCLTKALAKAMAPTVTVNAVAPGVAVFPDDYSDALRQRILRRVPLGRAGSPDDVARAVVYLVEDGDYITGTILPVDGGRSVT